MSEETKITDEPMFGNDAADSMKFSNGDVCLDEIIERNGGHYVVSNVDILLDTTW